MLKIKHFLFNVFQFFLISGVMITFLDNKSEYFINIIIHMNKSLVFILYYLF